MRGPEGGWTDESALIYFVLGGKGEKKKKGKRGEGGKGGEKRSMRTTLFLEISAPCRFDSAHFIGKKGKEKKEEKKKREKRGGREKNEERCCGN